MAPVFNRPAAWLGTGLALIASGAAYAWYYFTEAVKAPKLYFLPGGVSNTILEMCKTLLSPYHPTPWAINTHLQTVIGYLRLASIHGSYTRQLIQLSDGGTVALDWFDGCDAWDYAPPYAPVFLVMHGINGGSHEGYCKWACAAALSKGWRAVVLNYRGCNGLQLTSPRGYWATMTGDVRVALDSVKSRFPSAPIFAVGYSLGSLMLTKYVSEADRGMHGWRGGSGLVAAAMVSNPICLKLASHNLSQQWSPKFAYNLVLAHKLKEYCKTHESFISSNTRVDLDKVMGSWTVGEVEDLTLFESVGFTREEYHQQVSSQYHIPHIRTPSLFLISEDDPFLGHLPVAECSANPFTVLAVTQVGGHVAFLQGVWPLNVSWMDEVVVEFMHNSWQRQQAQEREEWEREQQEREWERQERERERQEREQQEREEQLQQQEREQQHREEQELEQQEREREQQQREQQEGEHAAAAAAAAAAAQPLQPQTADEAAGRAAMAAQQEEEGGQTGQDAHLLSRASEQHSGEAEQHPDGSEHASPGTITGMQERMQSGGLSGVEGMFQEGTSGQEAPNQEAKTLQPGQQQQPPSPTSTARTAALAQAATAGTAAFDQAANARTAAIDQAANARTAAFAQAATACAAGAPAASTGVASFSQSGGVPGGVPGAAMAGSSGALAGGSKVVGGVATAGDSGPGHDGCGAAGWNTGPASSLPGGILLAGHVRSRM